MVEEFDGQIRDAGFKDPFDLDVSLNTQGIGRVNIPKVRGVLRMIIFDAKESIQARFAIKIKGWPGFLLKTDFINGFKIFYPKGRSDDISGGKFTEFGSDIYLNDDLEVIVEGAPGKSVRLLLRVS